jgi:crotonobetainyl-CoA:carnitine CoA-transferase CaiB-like acyl-CoA transferase
MMGNGHPLSGLVVTELGGREAVAICGSLLAQLGATVIVVEPCGAPRMRDGGRAQFTSGKLSVTFTSAALEDQALVDRLIKGSDMVLTSSDVDADDFRVEAAQSNSIVCDITAFGCEGPHSEKPLSELQLQALSGIVETTGPADGPPIAINVPIVSYAAGVYAAAAVLAALRVKRRDGYGQRIDVAMFDAALVSLNAFLAGVLTGQVDDRTRVGNRHPTVAAWNLYEAADGWVFICAGNQGQWERLCEQMDRADIAVRYATQASRILCIEEVDAAIEAWTRTLSVADCINRLVTAGVAAGAIANLDGYPREANLDFRGMIRRLFDPVGGGECFVPASPLAMRGSPPAQPEYIPAPGESRAEVERIARALPTQTAVSVPPVGLRRPLAGFRVIEIGQYTTAPLCARHLAHLGADVIKVEKPGGDEQRAWEPHFAGRSETFCLNNSDKRGLSLDLHSVAGRDVLRALLRSADVLVENNKPGTLAKFGFSPKEIAEINPNLIHCAISAFGASSLYADRPGFDTVIQATSGFMAALSPTGIPQKSGISTADVMGAQVGIVAIMAALEDRDRTGRGQYVDLSMQDISCWLTAPLWNIDRSEVKQPAVLPCADGFVLLEPSNQSLTALLQESNLTFDSLKAMTKISVAKALGSHAVPIHTVKEASQSSHATRRRVWYTIRDREVDWPVLASPMRLTLTPPEVEKLAPEVDQDREVILRELAQASERLRVKLSV